MDKMKTVYAQHDISGVVEQVPADHLNHPVLGAHLHEVRNGKRRARLADIVDDTPDNQDDTKSSATRLTEPASPDKSKED